MTYKKMPKFCRCGLMESLHRQPYDQGHPFILRASDGGKPRILITVEGGVATVYADGECEIVRVDFNPPFEAQNTRDIDDRLAYADSGADYPFDDWAERVWKETQ